MVLGLKNFDIRNRFRSANRPETVLCKVYKRRDMSGKGLGMGSATKSRAAEVPNRGCFSSLCIYVGSLEDV